jgi:uncharacterized membrane protein
MSATEQTIEVEAPIRTVYNQWTQFASFPKFMHGVERVDQKRDDLVHFVVRIGGHTVEYDAEITAQVPDKCVSWQSKAGRETGGEVRFEKIDDNHTRVHLKLGYEPVGPLENVADLVNVVGMQARNDLKRFKEFIESRGREEGAWRGTIRK